MDMIQANAFNTINVLDRAADAASLRNTAISNNIANVDTPGYKRQDVDFESILQREYKGYSSKSGGVRKRISRINDNLDSLDAGIYTDSVGYSYRIDENNVDIDTENAELAANTEKYNGLIDAITGGFRSLSKVMK